MIRTQDLMQQYFLISGYWEWEFWTALLNVYYVNELCEYFSKGEGLNWRICQEIGWYLVIQIPCFLTPITPPSKIQPSSYRVQQTQTFKTTL